MYNILLVEDDRITSKLIQRYIFDLGYYLAGAVSSGEEAADLINTHEPDVVLMDINLSGKLDGIESAKNINTRFSIPFIYITSSSDYSTIERAKESNAYGYIIKPFNKKDLRATVEMALLRHHMENRIKDNENRVFTILNSILDSVIVIDEAGDIDYINASASRMLSLPEEEIIGKPVSEVIKLGTDPKDEGNVFFPMSMNYIEFNNYLTSGDRKIPVDFTSTPLTRDNGKIRGAVLVVRDITQQVEYDRRIQESMDTLTRAMYGTIEAITKTVETKDPYTAGHQKKVADIAKEIAKDMGLSRDVIESVNLAGQIHDLGKIAIPSEILNKPGRINEIEFALIKTHPEMGYEIVKNIDFPWPIADIVFQHHEKIDGSGYPRGLKGDNILIQARIISVADVLEAMASHRPYRAALGVDAAFEELKSHAGTSFDKDVVDSCLRIFREKGFKMVF